MAQTPKTPKKVYVCSECDYQSAKWMGRCPSCNAWNSFVEETYTPPLSSAAAAAGGARRANLTGKSTVGGDGERAVRFSDFTVPEYMRVDTGIGELNRVLGGGLVTGSVILLAGEPGIGKSTLLMQLCGKIGSARTVLYVSGEESKGQLKLRAERLHADGEKLFILTETNIHAIVAEYEKVKPEIVIVDSIQTMYSDLSASVQGSVTQVRECASVLIGKAKTDGAAVIIVGHVNKEGGIAGPKVLEHMVDAVLSFEGERRQSNRIIRAIKNRYGSTNEIGVFAMTDEGLVEIENPSAMLLEERPVGVSGSCAVCILEGTRPIIAEIQALAAPSTLSSPRRTADGIDYNRMNLLLAVLEKRVGLRFSAYDVYLNVVGGLRIDEPAADAAIALALISSIRDIPVPENVIAMGELGLSGEFRTVSHMDKRFAESHRLGFTKIAIPRRTELRKIPDGVEVVRMGSIYDAIRLLAKPEQEKTARTDREV